MIGNIQKNNWGKQQRAKVNHCLDVCAWGISYLDVCVGSQPLRLSHKIYKPSPRPGIEKFNVTGIVNWSEVSAPPLRADFEPFGRPSESLIEGFPSLWSSSTRASSVFRRPATAAIIALRSAAPFFLTQTTYASLLFSWESAMASLSVSRITSACLWLDDDVGISHWNIFRPQMFLS